MIYYLAKKLKYICSLVMIELIYIDGGDDDYIING